MNRWQHEIEDAMSAFEQVASLAAMPISRAHWGPPECWPAPHEQPGSLPSGKMAIYGFWGDGAWLKIGMVGAKSQARYTSQHYNPGSARSTIAASLANDPRMRLVAGFDPERPGEWLKTHCHRVNILLDAKHGRPLLALLEAFLHVRLNPRYER